MSNKKYPNTSPKKYLSPSEALQMIQLESSVEEYRLEVFEYMLLRASLTTNKVEKKAWWILAALMTFVESHHRFPHMKEQNEFLGIVLGTHRVPELPILQLVDLVEQKEIGIQARNLRAHRKKSDEQGLIEDD